MITEQIEINGRDAVVLGERSDSAFLFVHGSMGTKEDCEFPAGVICPEGHQILSVDMPWSGRAKAGADRFDPLEADRALRSAMGFARSRWKRLSLMAVSIGAWFSMAAFCRDPIDMTLFVSPIPDMAALIAKMAEAAGGGLPELESKGRLESPSGETLEWERYLHAKRFSGIEWKSPTSILFGGGDEMTTRGEIEEFAKRNGCHLAVMENGEHWFHTPEQLDFMREWIRGRIRG